MRNHFRACGSKSILMADHHSTRFVRTLLGFLLALSFGPALAAADPGWVALDPNEAGANLSSRYAVTVNGTPVPVIKIQGGAVPSYVHFSFAGEVHVRITVNEPVSSYTLTPKSYGIASAASGQVITFTLNKPRHLILHHVNSSTESLGIFADAIEDDAARLGGSGVINVMDYGVDSSGGSNNSAQIQNAINAIPTNGTLYFPAGRYTANGLNCKADSTIYLSAGAVIQSSADASAGTMFSINAPNVTIKGRGVLDGRGDVNRAAGRMYNLIENHANNWTLAGVILRNPTAWNIMTYGNNLTFRNVKWIGNMDNVNTDGIGTTGTGITVDDCVIMNNDDPFALHTLGSGDTDCNTHINNTVVFNQVGGGRMFLLGFYTSSGVTSNWNAENLDHADGYRIIGNTTGNTFEIWAQGAGGVANCQFNNIRVENPPNSLFAGVNYWSFGGGDNGNGKISNIRFNEIQQESFGAVGSSPWPNGANSFNSGWYPANNSGNTISDISFANYFVDGAKVNNPSDGRFSVGNQVSNLSFPSTAVAKVNINASDLIADDGGSNPGAFTVTRTGSTGSALTVQVAVRGTAGNGADYNAIATFVTIPAGASAAPIVIVPKPGGGGTEYRTVLVSLVQNNNYMMDANYHAVVTIIHGGSADTQPPGSPTGLNAADVTATAFTCAWNAANDNVSVTGYEVFVDGASAGTTATTSLRVTGLSRATTYAVAVRARDAAGNWSSMSTALQVTTSSAAAGATFTGTYYNSFDLSGSGVVREDAAINFDWGLGSPLSGINNDFSARWRGTITPTYGESYTFTATTDDGVRLWIDGILVIDHWVSQAAIPSSGTITLTAGRSVELVMEYYDGGWDGSAKLEWQSASQARQLVPAGASALVGQLPAGWTAADVSTPGATGLTTVSGGTWTVVGAGADIWGTADECEFVSMPVTGDVSITARVESETNTNAWAKAGVMLRESTATGSRHAYTCVTSMQGTAFQRRLTADGPSTHTGGPGKPAPYWVRLERIGTTCIGSVSPDGATWTEIRRETIAMSSQARVGLAVTSHEHGTRCTAVFTNVEVISAAAASN